MKRKERLFPFSNLILPAVVSLLIIGWIYLSARKHILPSEEEGAAEKTAIVHKNFSFIDHIDEGIQRTAEKDRKMISVIRETVADEQRRALLLAPDSSIEFMDMEINPGASLHFGLGIIQKMWDKGGDGVVFSVSVKRGGSKSKNIFEKYIDPKNRPRDRRWFDISVPLKAFENQVVDIIFSTDSGPRNDNTGDGAVWSGLKLVSEGKEIRVKKRIRNGKHNVLVITVDTLRADFLGCYGKTDISTPVIDSLASAGALFENAISQSSMTNPSHGSIMSSLYLKDHGVYSNTDALPDGVFTLAEYFSEKGYQTAAIVASTHLNDEHSGLGQGFQYFFGCPSHQRSAEDVNSTISWWIEDNYDKPFFIWIHYYDPHAPYTPPRPYDTMYYEGDPKKHEENSMREARLNHPQKLEWLEGVRDINFPVSQYMGEISYVDHSIGGIVAVLENLGILDDTIVVLTADHGESLIEHGVYFAHYGLFEDVIRVPLIVYAPEQHIPSKRIANLVESVDIFPTILDLLEMPVPERLRGMSLVPLILGKTDAHKKNAYSEMALGMQRSIRTENYKFIESLSNGHKGHGYMFQKNDLELYRLQTDPEELENLAFSNPDIVAELRDKLENWPSMSLELRPTEEKEVSPELLEHLRALGYLE